MTTSPTLSLRLTEALPIRTTLDRLCDSPAPLLAFTQGSSFSIRLLTVDPSERLLRFVPEVPDETAFKALSCAPSLHWVGSFETAQISFDVKGIGVHPSDSDPRFPVLHLSVPFPEEIERLQQQRRNVFRILAVPPDTRRAIWRPDVVSVAQHFRIKDVSLGGLGLRSDDDVDGLPVVGQMLNEVLLDFNEFGEWNCDLRVVAVHSLEDFHPVLQHVTRVSHLGCEFAGPDFRRDTFMQRLIYRLEVQRRRDRG